MTPEMHFNASRSLTQPLLDCIRHNIYMIQALYQALQISVSLGKWVSSLSRIPILTCPFCCTKVSCWVEIQTDLETTDNSINSTAL